MPAASESALVPLPHTWRPVGPRIAAVVSVSVLLVLMGFLWIGFDDETRASVTLFQRGTALLMFFLGFAVLNALARSRVDAEKDRLVVINGYRRHEYEWPEVLAVHLPAGAPWVTLDLANGGTISAMGIQGSDGARAKQAVRELRGLIDRSDAPGDR